MENGNIRLVCIRGEDIIKSRDPLCRAQVQRTVTSCICRQGRRKYIDWWVFSFSNWYDFVFREENILPHCMCHTSSVEWNTLVYIFHMLMVAGGYVRFFFGSAAEEEYNQGTTSNVKATARRGQALCAIDLFVRWKPQPPTKCRNPKTDKELIVTLNSVTMCSLNFLSVLLQTQNLCPLILLYWRRWFDIWSRNQ